MEIYFSFHYICAWEMSFILQGDTARTLRSCIKRKPSGIKIANWPFQGAKVSLAICRKKAFRPQKVSLNSLTGR